MFTAMFSPIHSLYPFYLTKENVIRYNVAYKQQTWIGGHLNKTTTNISVRGNRNFINGVRMLAAAKGMAIADVVRLALDTTYGEELARHVRFFEENDASLQQKGTASHNECTMENGQEL
jgi:hypothetical protein